MRAVVLNAPGDITVEGVDDTLDPSPVFTSTVPPVDIARGYRNMDERRSMKVLVRP